MLGISTCPRCQKSVSIPSGIDSDTMVRCPLCNAEYVLGEAFPPELIPVLGVKAEGDEENTITIPIEPGDELVESVEAETYGLADHQGVEEKEEENEAVAAMRRVPKTAGRARRQPKSGLQRFIEVVTGGLAGLLVGYYALAFYLGPELKNRGFPILTYLPGITRLTTPAEKATTVEKEKSSADTSAKPKPANGESPKKSELPKEPPKTSIEKPAEQVPANKLPSEAVAPTPEVKEAKFLRPKLGTAEYVGPRSPKSGTSDELEKVLGAAKEKATDLTSADAYEAFCRLGETLAFVNGDASDTQLTDRIAAARTAVEAIAKRSEAFEKLRQAANDRIDAVGGQNVGVLLAGTVKNVGKQGRLQEATIDLAGPSKTVTVLSDQEAELKVGNQVVVVGIVVREPSANLVGYSGNKSAVVWAATLIKVP